MQTYSHYIITVALNRNWAGLEQVNGSLQLAGYKLPPLKKVPLLVGSVLPDLLLILLAIGTIGYDWMQGTEFGPGRESADSTTRWLFDYAFFNVWWVKAAHNLFHGPVMILFYLITGYFAWRAGRQWGASLFWLAVACMIHTAIDIPLHYDDGPLLLFPFDMNLRFYSPVSYWDPQRYGNIFAPLEHLFIVGLLIYLVVSWWRTKKSVSPK